jgi:hypothetical protein
MLDLPAHPFRAAAARIVSVSSRSLVRIEGGFYSVPCRWPREAARRFAHVLGAIVRLGEPHVAIEIARAFTHGTSLTLALAQLAPPLPTVALDRLPPSVAGIEVLVANARDYDVLLGVASGAVHRPPLTSSASRRAHWRCPASRAPSKRSRDKPARKAGPRRPRELEAGEEHVFTFAGDEKLATALIDRLADRGTIMTTKGKSFRLQRRRTREPAAGTTKSPAGPAHAEMSG